MADALAQLKARMAELDQLSNLGMLLSWDQRTQMPPAGARHRGELMAFTQRLGHNLLTDPEVGKLLDQIDESTLDPDSFDHGTVRIARKAYEKEVNVPGELRADMARAAAEGNSVWLKAKAGNDFELFRPALEKNIELRRKLV